MTPGVTTPGSHWPLFGWIRKKLFRSGHGIHCLKLLWWWRYSSMLCNWTSSNRFGSKYSEAV